MKLFWWILHTVSASFIGLTIVWHSTGWMIAAMCFNIIIGACCLRALKIDLF